MGQLGGWGRGKVGVGRDALNAGGRLLHSIKTRRSQVVAAVCGRRVVVVVAASLLCLCY